MAREEKWELVFISGICIGIGVVLSKCDKGTYRKMILNTILPKTDKEYKKQKKEIEETMQLICDLYNNLKNGMSYTNT